MDVTFFLLDKNGPNALNRPFWPLFSPYGYDFWSKLPDFHRKVVGWVLWKSDHWKIHWSKNPFVHSSVSFHQIITKIDSADFLLRVDIDQKKVCWKKVKVDRGKVLWKFLTVWKPHFYSAWWRFHMNSQWRDYI